MSIEPTRFFLHEVDAAEHSYHEEVSSPMCLTTIQSKLTAPGGYKSWGHFEVDVELMINNALAFNDDDTLGFHLANMLKKEFDDAREALRALGLPLDTDDE